MKFRKDIKELTFNGYESSPYHVLQKYDHDRIKGLVEYYLLNVERAIRGDVPREGNEIFDLSTLEIVLSEVGNQYDDYKLAMEDSYVTSGQYVGHWRHVYDVYYKVHMREDEGSNNFVPAQPALFCGIPVIGDDLTIDYKGRKYSIINHLEEKNIISYDEGEKIRFITDKRKWTIDLTKTKTVGVKRLNMTNDTNNLLHLFSYYTYGEGGSVVNAEYIMSKLMKVSSIFFKNHNTTRVEGKVDWTNLLQAISLAGRGPIKLNDRLQYDSISGALDLKEVKDQLHDLLSFNWLVGMKLYEPVKLKDGGVLPKGTRLTLDLIDLISDNEIKVCRDYSLLVGKQLAEEFQTIIDLKEGTFNWEYFHKYTNPKDLLVRDEVRDVIVKENKNTKLDKAFLEWFGFYSEAVSFNNTLKIKEGTNVIDVEPYITVFRPPSKDKEKSKMTIDELIALVNNCYLYKDGYDTFTSALNIDRDFRRHVVSITDFVCNILTKHIDTKFSNKLINVFKQKFNKSREMAIANKESSYKELLSGSLLNENTQDYTINLFRGLESNNCIQEQDRTNPISKISSNTKAIINIKDANAVKDEHRYLTLQQFNRICGYETPQSGKLGVTMNVAKGCNIENSNMIVKYKRLIHSNGKTTISDIEDSFTQLSKTNITLVDRGLLPRDTNEFNSNMIVLAGSVDRTGQPIILNVQLKECTHIVDSVRSMSWACSTIPFFTSNDATRLSFGVSMAKQTKPLVNPEKPIVYTPAYWDIPNYTKDCIRAEEDGEVVLVDAASIITENKSYDILPIECRYNTYNSMRILVKKGDYVKKGQIIAEGSCVIDGLLSLGVNALIAYHPDRFNYEDGNTISKSFAYKMASYKATSEEVTAKTKTKQTRVHGLEYDTYIKKGVKWGLAKVSITKDGNKLDRRDFVKRSKGLQGFIVTKESKMNYTKSVLKSEIVRAVGVDELSVVDKICNRYGNKGETCRVLDNSEMYYLANNVPIDICYNPCGVPSRMNIGQILECHLGFACYVLGIRTCDEGGSPPNKQQIKQLMKFAYDCANTDNIDEVISKYTDIYPQELLEYVQENHYKIKMWKGTFDENGGVTLYNPKTGKPLKGKATVGINYIYKQVQQGDTKLNVREGLDTSSYISLTQRPTKGIKENGGQSIGYMELHNLLGYGADNFLYDLYNKQGDNYVQRYNDLVRCINREDVAVADETGVRRVNENFFFTMEALGCMLDYPEVHHRQVYKMERLSKLKSSKGVDNSKDIQVIREEIKRVEDFDWDWE